MGFFSFMYGQAFLFFSVCSLCGHTLVDLLEVGFRCKKTFWDEDKLASFQLESDGWP